MAQAPWETERKSGGGKQPMGKYRSERLAAVDAKKRGLKYGLSVAGGNWYVGTEEQLKKAAVADIKG
jgi:hypothetical protein